MSFYFAILSPEFRDIAKAAMGGSIQPQKSSHRAHLAGLDALFASLQHRAFHGEL